MLSVTVLAAVAFGAVVVASALADNTVWLVNGAQLTSKVLVDSESTGKIVLTDMGLPAAVECEEVLNEGWVGPGSEDEITSIEFMKACTHPEKAETLSGELVANACTSVDAIRMVDLPWKTLLELINGVTWGLILPTTNGEPGYQTECGSALGLVTDTCKTTAGNNVGPELTNLENGTVLAEFELNPALSEKENATCSLGGAENGLVVGGNTLLLVVASGMTLATSVESSSALADNTVWLVNGAQLTSKVLVDSESTGKIVLTDMGLPAAVECEEVLNEGWVGPGSEDEITSIEFMKACTHPEKAETLSGELVANACTSVDAVRMVDLPWKTLLELINGVTWGLILPTTNGEPGYQTECGSALGLVTDTCKTTAGNNVGPELTNLENGTVLAEFELNPALSEKENATCSLGGAENGLVVGGNTLLLVVASGMTLATSVES